jgi:exoribonuclease R
MMLRGGVGMLRWMTEADRDGVARFRRQAGGLGVPWPAETSYGDFLRALDRTNPRHLALIHDATMLFRGAGYTPFDGAVPEQTEQAAVAAPYAHVTAPLRRLVDRFGLAVCEALSSGADVPDWVRTALPALPEVMERSDQLAGSVDRACLNVVEAAALRTNVGQTFPAAVVELRGDDESLVQVEDPAILAPCAGRAELGEEVRVRLVEADMERRVVRFELADPAPGADPVS